MERFFGSTFAITILHNTNSDGDGGVRKVGREYSEWNKGHGSVSVNANIDGSNKIWDNSITHIYTFLFFSIIQ